ncbi:hypothetical protein SE17_10710 [Kouleothrix aurantiaca]|uniref:Uncharacterized protein n=1 Tax=Kouleothrix aurantiaca TaxID=186479 RepID=A0A0P9F9E5_9CHLR|nr:hypothetical protein SE17_10710 [Kouleothrix aurantiaca]
MATPLPTHTDETPADHALLYQDVWPGLDDSSLLWKGRAIWRIADRIVKIESVVPRLSMGSMTASLFDGCQFHPILTFDQDELALVNITLEANEAEDAAMDAFTNDVAEMLVVIYSILTGNHTVKGASL